MQEQLKSFLGKVKTGWANTSKKVKKFIFAGVAIAVIIAIIVVIINFAAPYSTLFTGLNQTDMTNVITYLSDNAVTDYRIQGSDTILVKSSQVAQLKADLLMQGYPSSGFGYSTYLDNVGTLTTESERNTLKLYGLQDEMEAVIRCFDFVNDAQVMISPGEDNTYVLDSGNIIEASASVMVTMTSGQMLSQQQVEAISNLVKTAVQGLEIDNISITDTAGNTYSASSNGIGSTQDAATLKLDLEREVNNTLRSNIMFVLEPLFGADNIRISVNSTVNVSRSVTESVNYSLEDWAQDGSTGGEGIIGSKIYDQEIIRNNDETEGGAAGTTTNSDINTYVEDEAAGDPNLDQLANYGEEEFLVDTENTQSENLGGTVTDVMVSITLNSNATGGMNESELYSLVARAAGINSEIQQEKINIMMAPFYEDGAQILQPSDLSDYIIYIIIGAGVFILLLIIIIILASIGRRKKRKKEQEQEQLQAQVNMVNGMPQAVHAGITPNDITDQIVDIMDIRSDRSVELRKTVRDFAQQNPEIAAQMVKNWLKEGDEANG